MRARYYDQTTGRFISKDPFGGELRDPVSLHRYLYANANPVTFADPSGQFTEGLPALLNSFAITVGNIVRTAVIGGLAQGALQFVTTGKVDVYAVARTIGVGIVTGGFTKYYFMAGLAVKIAFNLELISRTRHVYVQDLYAQILLNGFIGFIAGKVTGKDGVIGEIKSSVGLGSGLDSVLLAKFAIKIIALAVGIDEENNFTKLLEEGFIKRGSELNQVLICKGRFKEIKDGKLSGNFFGGPCP